MQRGIGHLHQLLIERAGPDGARGRTGEYRKMRIPGGLPGELLTASAKNLDGDTLVGVLCDDDGIDGNGSSK